MEILKTVLATLVWAWCKLCCTVFDKHSFFPEDVVGKTYCSDDLCKEEVIRAKSCCCDKEIEFHISWDDISRKEGGKL